MHTIIDSKTFISDFSKRMDPEYPDSLSFWKVMSKEEKDSTMAKRPDLWKSDDGVGYLNALSKVRAENSRNMYWLPILEKEMRVAKDEKRLGRVLECLSTYKNMEVDNA